LARTPNRREPLLDAALVGFAQRGYAATSVAELAASTGMSKAAVSYHFPSKNDLLHAFVDPLLDALDALAERHPKAPKWPEEMQALLQDYLSTLIEHRDVAAWVDSDKAVLNHPEIGARLQNNNERMCQAITGSTTHGAVAAVRAMAVLGSLWRPVRVLPAAQLVAHQDTLVHTAMSGCAPNHAAPQAPTGTPSRDQRSTRARRTSSSTPR
jgi:AcrR family transcriptional regulator